MMRLTYTYMFIGNDHTTSVTNAAISVGMRGHPTAYGTHPGRHYNFNQSSCHAAATTATDTIFKSLVQIKFDVFDWRIRHVFLQDLNQILLWSCGQDTGNVRDICPAGGPL